MKKSKNVLALAGVLFLASVFASCSQSAGNGFDNSEDIFKIGDPNSCGITLRDTKNPFTIFYIRFCCK